MIDVPVTYKIKQLTSTRKRDCVFQSVPPSVELRTSSHWDGGSISYYRVVNMRTGHERIPASGTFPSFTDAKCKLEDGEILIQTRTVTGKPGRPFITCRTDNESEAKVFLGI